MEQAGPQKLIQSLCLFMMLSWGAMSAQIRVVSDGHPGATSAELEALLPGAIQSVQPRAAVIFAGANDALNDRKLLPASVTAQHLTAMVRMLRAGGTDSIVLVTVHQPDLTRLMQRHPASAYGKLSPAARLAQVDRAILQVAQREHVRLARFDEKMAAVGGANSQWSTDGVHLTKPGYAMLADVVYHALPRPVPAGSTVLCFGDSLTYGIGVRAPGATDNPDTYPSQLQSLLDGSGAGASTETSHSIQR